jgi:hypothetical protein
MRAYSFTEMLMSNGWTAESGAPFAEKAGQGADAYFSFKNGKGNLLTLCVFEKDANVRFRVFDPGRRDVSWLQIVIDGDIDGVIAKIVEKQDEITQEGAFGFYFEVSGLGDVSILAWEQWEDNYR